MKMRQELWIMPAGLFLGLLSSLGTAPAALIVKPVGLTAMPKTISEPGEGSADVFQIFNTSTASVEITDQEVVCPNTGGDRTDSITCGILASVVGRTIPGTNPDGTQHSIFGSVSFENSDPADVGPLADGKNTITYTVTANDGSVGKGTAIVFVSDVPEPNTTVSLLGAGAFFLGYSRRRKKHHACKNGYRAAV
jgi:hypothetical protein